MSLIFPGLTPLPGRVLATRIIPDANDEYRKQFELKDGQRSLGLLTCTSDDPTYAGIDEATKQAEVEVVYAKSFWAGAAHSSGPNSGEIIAILAGPNPEEVRSGLQAAVETIQNQAFFYGANPPQNTIAFFAYPIAQSGTYLSKEAGVEAGAPLAYLVAPPIEATYAVDAAIKAADVRMGCFYEPPTPTNFSGALLTGSEAACRAACQAFAESVQEFERGV